MDTPHTDLQSPNPQILKTSNPQFIKTSNPQILQVLLLLFALCTLNFELSAQYFSLGTDPASVKWKQVKTEHFRVIFPDNMEDEGIRVANTLEYYRSPASASLDAKPGRWPVILHNRTIISNAVTPYAPKRIDMMTMPPQDNYGQDWLDQLVIHEFRHSVQYTAVNRGFTKALSILMGQQAVPAIMGLFVPFWFIEGDAVATETALTQTGRGRVPSFEMKIRAQFLEKGLYSYDKAYNGSLKDFTPDWYELGYQIVGHSRLNYGLETWSKVMKRTGNVPFILVPFSNTLCRQTGYGKSRLYNHIAEQVKQSWEIEDQNITFSQYKKVLSSDDRFYTNRTQPAILPDGSFLARKTSIDDITRIVRIDPSGKEKVIINVGYMPDECLSASGNLVCWAQLDQDPRWSLRNYSVVMIHNLETGKTAQLTQKTRYFAPAIDATAKRIAVVETDESGHHFLVILDAFNGQVISRFPTPENYAPSYPSWSPDGKQIVLILNKDQGKGIAVLNSDDGNYETALNFSTNEISKPSFYGDYILFTGSYTGIDNIFALDLKTKNLFQVTSARFGATDAEFSKDGKTLYYSNYTSDGYEIVTANLEPGTWNPEPETWNPEPETLSLADQLSEQEDFQFNAKSVADSAYTVKHYRKGLNLFNFHSWAPIAIDIDNINAYPGVTLLSQNLLGTSFTTLGYEYNLNEKTSKYSMKYSYEGWYPAFDLQADYGLRRGMTKDTVYYDFDELNLSAWVRVPLNWNVKSWFVGLQPYAGYSYELLKMNPDFELRFRKDRFNSLNTKLYFYAQSRMSERDLAPRWAQSLDLNFRQTLFEADTASSIFAAELNLYFPGLFRHHSIRFYSGYQERVTYYYPYSDQIILPRGYTHLYPGKMFSGSANYTFPIFYPDWNIGPVIYLKRLNANLFCDYALSFDQDPNQDYISTGIDLTFDFHLFRWFAPLEAGLRTIYLPEAGTFSFELLYSVDLSY